MRKSQTYEIIAFLKEEISYFKEKSKGVSFDKFTSDKDLRKILTNKTINNVTFPEAVCHAGLSSIFPTCSESQKDSRPIPMISDPRQAGTGSAGTRAGMTVNVVLLVNSLVTGKIYSI